MGGGGSSCFVGASFVEKGQNTLCVSYRSNKKIGMPTSF